MKLLKSWIKLCGVAVATLSSTLLTYSAVHIDAYGWTVVTPSEDSRIVYVSSSEGDDSNDGLSPETPKATIEAADLLIRDGYPDHLLLKRGDTFYAGETTLGQWKNGRSADEPLLVSYYGESGPRPLIELTGYFINHDLEIRSYQTIIGLDFYRAISDPQSEKFSNTQSQLALRIIGGGSNITIEDCRFRFTGIVAQSWHAPGSPPQVYKDFQLRRNIITDTWVHNSWPAPGQNYRHTSGIFVSGVHGYLMEENFFDHNGWNAEVEWAGTNMFAHNVYIQRNNAPGGVIRGNISARAAAHGMQARSGGVLERNLYVNNAIGVNIGGNGVPLPEVLDFNNRLVQNVVLDGRTMDPITNSFPRTTAVWGIVGAYVGNVDLIDNIVANRIGSGNNRGIHTDQAPITFNNVGTIVYEWNPPENQNDPSWPHPEHGLGDYNAYIGGENDILAYYQAQRDRGLREFPWELTAYAAISYIRAGFNKSAVGGYYEYEGYSDVPAASLSLSTEQLQLWVNETIEVMATIEPVEAGNQGVTWSSENTDVATVNPYGIVTGINTGTTNIIARSNDGDFSVSVSVEVQAAATTGVSMEPESLDLFTGMKYQLTASAAPVSAIQTLTWSSENENVAIVSNEGVVTAVGAGTTLITATSVEGTHSASTTVNIQGGSSWPNIAFGANVTVTAEIAPSVGANLVNGDKSLRNEARWWAKGQQQTITLDLNDLYTIDEFRIHPFDPRDYQYTIEVSEDGETWDIAVDFLQNTQEPNIFVHPVNPTDARYIRINITGCNRYDGPWVSLSEIEVFGQLANGWAGFPINEEQMVDTGINFLGLIHIEDTPWIRCESLGIWLYLPEENVSQQGAWAYVISTETFVQYESSEWFISPALRNWIQVPELANSEDGSQWVYFVR